jgi:hypothetical protein
MSRFVIFAILVFAVFPRPCTAQAERRSFSFSPQPYDRCDYFMITEFSTSAVAMKVPHSHLSDQFLFTDSFGFMKNLEGGSALGASIDLHLSDGSGDLDREAIQVAPTLRYKHWLPRKQSLDLSIGYIPKGADLGLVGPIANLRYSPLSTFYVQAGVCQFREFTLIPGSFYEYHEERKTRLFGGAGVGGVPATIFWGVQLVGAVVVAGSLAASGWGS